MFPFPPWNTQSRSVKWALYYFVWWQTFLGHHRAQKQIKCTEVPIRPNLFWLRVDDSKRRKAVKIVEEWKRQGTKLDPRIKIQNKSTRRKKTTTKYHPGDQPSTYWSDPRGVMKSTSPEICVPTTNTSARKDSKIERTVLEFSYTIINQKICAPESSLLFTRSW